MSRPTQIGRCPTLLASAIAFAVAVAALGSAIGIPELPEPLAVLDRRLPGVFRLHMVASGLGLLGLPWIVAVHSRPELHRRLGRIGAVVLFVGAATALPAALRSEAVLLARLGFLTQGVLCLAFLAGAVRAIRARDIERHARCMLQVGATIFGAVVLRIMMALAAVFELPFDAAYAAIAWLSWALPLAIVSIWPPIRLRQGLARAGG
jgi:hypothetical protein